ncbi:MAG: hypothetical protein KGS61_05340 [Verrucomicrobia bacterium]|nr:hypothetical protein [Verrucomicrobiota bacterium]
MNHSLLRVTATHLASFTLLVYFWGTRIASGQGLVEFENLAPIYDVDGRTLLVGSGFLAELYAAAPGNSLQPISSSITPLLTVSPGYFFGGIVHIPGTIPGGTAVVQVVTWRASDGATFAEADHPGAHVGGSSVFQVGSLGGDQLGVPALLVGMQSFSLYVVPEPAVLTLDLLAVVGIAFNCWLNRRV